MYQVTSYPINLCKMSWSMLDIIALWRWFCPCRVGGAVWNHTAWLFPLMPLPTESLFYSYFLSGNKYRKKHHLYKCWAISVLYQFITISIDLKICTMSEALKSKMIWRCCIHNTFGKTIGPHVTMVTQLIVSWHWQTLQKCKRKWSPMIKKQLARNDLTLDQ